MISTFVEEKVVSLTLWLESKVKMLECEIRSSDVFEAESPSSADEMADLRKKIILHRYLAQALESRKVSESGRRPSGEFALASLLG